jgi:nucleoside-diphosphate-sugar epimerase
MKALVTGAAGFVGSHLSEYLLSQGDVVHGIDMFTDYYPAQFKRLNVAALSSRPDFTLTEADLNEADLDAMLDGVDVVYHLAGQPGVRPSWGRSFTTYVRQNIEATQRLLEAVRDRGIRKLVSASSSSVYGDAERLPTVETDRPQPLSPYGVTKLAAEHLCELYRTNFGVPTASLRLFTVFGPRQRPDMAFRRMFDALVEGATFELYGDGTQTRDFTFVADVVAAFRAAGVSDWCGVANIGGGSRVSMLEVIEFVRTECGPLDVVQIGSQKGDVRHTGADTTVAAEGFGYDPQVHIIDGLREMAAWAIERGAARAS